MIEVNLQLIDLVSPQEIYKSWFLLHFQPEDRPCNGVGKVMIDCTEFILNFNAHMYCNVSHSDSATIHTSTFEFAINKCPHQENHHRMLNIMITS